MLPVLLFHAGVSGFAGGFLGVDIFFVISGFLITGILLREAKEGRFSIIAFYNRRVRRIFPALFALLAVTTIVAWLLLSPSALVRYARSLIFTTLFSSNILFVTEAGYFDTSSHEKLLLHTWSLAVEEQFYLVWPLILGTFFRFGAGRFLYPFLVTGVIGSFALAAIGPLWSVAGTFFLPFTRAWEIGLGAMLAVRPPGIANRQMREVAAAAGLAAILVSITIFDEITPLAIASGTACVGTAMLIACNSERTRIGRLLSTPIFVWIGLISYSLYLWHWPLLAFAHYYFAAPPNPAVRAGVLLLATGLATISYLFVETPLRRRGSPKKAFILSACVMTILVASGGTIIAFKGFPGRFSPELARADRALQRKNLCWGCGFGGKGDPEVVLWGDSHGLAVAPALDRIAADSGVPGISFSHQACPPLVGAQPARGQEREGSAGCRKRQERAIAGIAQLRKVNLIIVVGRWSIGSETTRFGQESGRRYFLRDAQSRERSVEDSRRALDAGLRRAVSTLLEIQPNARILLLGQAPEVGFEATECMARGMMYSRPTPQCERTTPGALDRLTFGNRLLSQIAAHPRVSALLLSPMLCTQDPCPTRIGDTFLYWDDNHLSTDGARLLLSDCVSQLLSRRGGPACGSRAFVE